MYLLSLDYSRFAIPRRIVRFEKLVISKRNAIKVWVDKPLIGQDFGYDNDIFNLYLIGRIDDTSLVDLNSFPISVFVLILKKGKTDFGSFDSFINVAWANIYDYYPDVMD